LNYSPLVVGTITPLPLLFNPRDTLLTPSKRRIMKAWVKLKEAAELLGVSTATVRYRALKKNMYKYRREVREYGETVVVSTQSLIEKHPELKETLEDDFKPPVKEDASIPSNETQDVRMVPAPEGGPRFVTEKSSLEVREEVVDTDRLRSLLDELEKVQHELEEVQKREQEIKKALKTLMERL
jgi:hypothetical protein